MFAFLLVSGALLGQMNGSHGNFWSNVRYGGAVGIGFGNGNFNAAISPSAIYQLSPEFAFGTSLSFNYAKFPEARLLAYGGSVLSLYNPVDFLQLSGELEQLRVNKTWQVPGGNFDEDYWSPALFIGAGYTNQNVTIGVRYNVLHDNNKSIYFNAFMPFIRVYF